MTTSATKGSLADIGVNFKVDPGQKLTIVKFLREATGHELMHMARERVPTLGWSTDKLGDYEQLLEASDGEDQGEKAWILRHQNPDQITLVHLHEGWADIWTAGDDAERALAVAQQLAEQLRAPEDDESIIPITFWALDPNRWPRAMRRNIETPSWASVSDNYAAETVAGMEQLLELNDTPEARLILWHGPAGTGKTHALRALGREWSDWCDVAFITDPEELVGGSPLYLLQVAQSAEGHSRAEAERRTKLVILEDSGELMSADARKSSGQGLSRLLNLTDGILGQGMRVMVLITTNEPVSTLHPAVVRPGRCLAEIGFPPLDPERANAWLERRGSGVTVEQPTTLAELYAITTGMHPTMSAATVS
jgi:hypothetical protein